MPACLISKAPLPRQGKPRSEFTVTFTPQHRKDTLARSNMCIAVLAGTVDSVPVGTHARAHAGPPPGGQPCIKIFSRAFCAPEALNGASPQRGERLRPRRRCAWAGEQMAWGTAPARHTSFRRGEPPSGSSESAGCQALTLLVSRRPAVTLYRRLLSERRDTPPFCGSPRKFPNNFLPRFLPNDFRACQ